MYGHMNIKCKIIYGRQAAETRHYLAIIVIVKCNTLHLYCTSLFLYGNKEYFMMHAKNTDSLKLLLMMCHVGPKHFPQSHHQYNHKFTF